MEDRGTIYVGAEWNQVLNNATPAMIARHHGYADIVKFLQATSDNQLRWWAASDRDQMVPMLERAQKAGVAHRLKPIPQWLHENMQAGTEEEKKVAKKELKKLQIANQQVVARAEQARMKQTTRVRNILSIVIGVCSRIV